jgi:hypothetical protein
MGIEVIKKLNLVLVSAIKMVKDPNIIKFLF